MPVIAPPATLVWLVDDDPSVADHVTIRLRRIAPTVEVRTFETGAGFLQAVQQLAADDVADPGLVLVDHFLPDASGVELVDAVVRRFPDARVAVITAAPDEVRRTGVRHEIVAKPLDVATLERLLGIPPSR